MGLVGDLLEKAARATPAAAEDHTTGWWLRHTDNSTWWSGAVLAHGAAGKIAERIDAAERFYAERGAVARFQICADCPPALDGMLAERGYRLEAPVALLTAWSDGVRRGSSGVGLKARADTTPGVDWLAVFRTTNGPGTDVEHETRLLRRVGREHGFVTVFADTEPVGIGRAVADGGWTGVFNMATIPSARRRGVGRSVLSAIAEWADAHGTPRLYLQVEQSNDAARHVYDAAGFIEVATYHYRVRGAQTDGRVERADRRMG